MSWRDGSVPKEGGAFDSPEPPAEQHPKVPEAAQSSRLPTESSHDTLPAVIERPLQPRSLAESHCRVDR